MQPARSDVLRSHEERPQPVSRGLAQISANGIFLFRLPIVAFFADDSFAKIIEDSIMNASLKSMGHEFESWGVRICAPKLLSFFRVSVPSCVSSFGVLHESSIRHLTLV